MRFCSREQPACSALREAVQAAPQRGQSSGVKGRRRADLAQRRRNVRGTRPAARLRAAAARRCLERPSDGQDDGTGCGSVRSRPKGLTDPVEKAHVEKAHGHSQALKSQLQVLTLTLLGPGPPSRTVIYLVRPVTPDRSIKIHQDLGRNRYKLRLHYIYLKSG